MNEKQNGSISLTKDECVTLIKIHNSFIKEKEERYLESSEIVIITELIRKKFIKIGCFVFEKTGSLLQNNNVDPITDLGLAAIERSWVKYCSEISRHMKVACCFDRGMEVDFSGKIITDSAVR